MKLFVFALLATAACTHTYNDRELGSPPKHPFNFKPVPAATASNDDRSKPAGDVTPPNPNNANSNRPADSDSEPTETQKPIRDARPDAFPPSGS